MKAPTWKTYACFYRIGGNNYVFEIKATSQRDAEQRLAMLKQTAVLEGEITATGQGAFQAEETMQ